MQRDSGLDTKMSGIIQNRLDRRIFTALAKPPLVCGPRSAVPTAQLWSSRGATASEMRQKVGVHRDVHLSIS